MANLRVNKITGTEVFETTGSVQFDGNGDYLRLVGSNQFDFGTGDFTIEAFVYPIATQIQFANIVCQATTGNAWYFSFSTSNFLTFSNFNDIYFTSSSALSTGVWSHVAVSRNGTSLKMYINGIEVGSVTNSISLGVTANVNIGFNGVSHYFNGHISNLRILKGTALYTKNFTPPTRELTVIPNTVLLCCQSTTRANEEITGKTITVNGNAVANELTPGLLTDRIRSGGSSSISGSVEFTTSIDALQVPAGSDFAYGTGDFTIEAWIRPQGINGGETKAIFTQTQSGNDYIVFKVDSDKAVKATFGATTITGGTVEVGSWNHVAVTRSSNTVRVFVNGIASSGTTVTTDFNDTTRIPTIGQYSHTFGTIKYVGFISNLRIIKGRAIYTSNFIPPTRELKKLPGTVLLCCQDSTNPLQEATGKTITPFGSLDRINAGVELVTNGTFDNGTTNWTANGSGSHTFSVVSGALQVVRGSSALGGGEPYQNITLEVNKRYVISYQVTSGDMSVAIYDGTIGGTTLVAKNDNLAGRYKLEFTNTGSTGTKQLLVIPNNLNTTAAIDNISVTKLDPGTKPAFTPSVGSDGSVTFDGVTKINSPNYFYLPTGNTEDRGRGRGVFGGGDPGATNNISFIEIQSTGNAQDFGDLTVARLGPGGFSSSTRGVFSNGFPNTNTIDYITISTTSNAVDFGDSTEAKHEPGACSSSTRGVVGGGVGAAPLTQSNVMDYVTIASLGNAQDFGDLTVARRNITSAQSPTRGIFFGGRVDPASVAQNIIDYITIATTGNALDFGDLTTTRGRAESVSNATRAVCIGGENPSAVTTMEYVTMSSTGNSVNFGTCSSGANNANNGASNSVRGVFHSAFTSPANTNNLDYITIAATGNTTDFGDLNYTQTRTTAFSDSHGGLG